MDVFYCFVVPFKEAYPEGPGDLNKRMVLHSIKFSKFKLQITHTLF